MRGGYHLSCLVGNGDEGVMDVLQVDVRHDETVKAV